MDGLMDERIYILRLWTMHSPYFLCFQYCTMSYIEGEHLQNRFQYLSFQVQNTTKNRFDKIGTRGQKSCCFDFLKVGYELFRSLLGIVFSLKRPTFSYIFNAKGLCMTSNIKILSLTFALCVGHFDHFRGKKQIFWDF